MELKAPDHYVKKRSDVCIVCGYDPKTREKWHCNSWGSSVNNGRHQYIYLADPKDNNA